MFFRSGMRPKKNVKATGIVRRLDENGRFVLPMELRKQLGIDTSGEALEVFVEDDRIILKKYSPSCLFCGSMDGLITYADKKICSACAEKINNIREGAAQ